MLSKVARFIGIISAGGNLNYSLLLLPPAAVFFYFNPAPLSLALLALVFVNWSFHTIWDQLHNRRHDSDQEEKLSGTQAQIDELNRQLAEIRELAQEAQSSAGKAQLAVSMNRTR